MLKSKVFNIVLPLIILFSIISSLISFYPLLISGPKAVFFNFEPEVAYVANALSYIGFKEISYAGHPATPSILSIATSFIPLRLYAKYIDHIPFFLWTIRNEFFLFYYVRVLESLIFTGAVAVFLYSIYKLTKNVWSVVFGWSGLFVYTNTAYLGIIPQSEPLSFLIISIWLLVFVYFLQRKKFNLYLILCILAGLSVANKLPNMFFVLASVGQVLSFNRIKFKKKLLYILTGTLSSVFAFFLATWQIRSQYQSLWQWILQLATHTGVHGGGEESVINLSAHLNSLTTLFSLERAAAVLILSTLLFWIISLKKRERAFNIPINILVTSMFLGILVFGKFSLSHYHQFHYVALLFIASYLSSKLNKGGYWVFLTLLLVFSIKSIVGYWNINVSETRKAIALEEFVQKNPPKVATVWEWGRSSDYALLHIQDWVGIRYTTYLKPERPNLFSLSTDMSKVVIFPGETKDVFSQCWDQLYIQKSEFNRFINKYPKAKLSIIAIDGSKDMLLITSSHCLKSK